MMQALSETMTAAYVTAPGESLEIRNVSVPMPGPGEILVRMEVCGLCHTDLHYWKGDHPLPRNLPVVLGHEGIGRVAKLGEGVNRIELGARVGTGFVHGTCGYCRECMSGHETHCGEIASTGVHVDGCFADFALLRADWATAIPGELEAAAAAPLLCAGVAAYSAVRKAKLDAGELVAVFGTGGLGSYAIQLAKLSGARVAAVDVSEEKLAHASRLGADYGISALGDPGAEIQKLGGADACFNFAPVASSWRQMLEAARARARIVLISLPNEPFSFEAAEVIESGLQVMGSADGTRLELRQLMELARAGKIESVVETVPFAEINSAFTRLEAGEVQGRLVIDMR